MGEFAPRLEHVEKDGNCRKERNDTGKQGIKYSAPLNFDQLKLLKIDLYLFALEMRARNTCGRGWYFHNSEWEYKAVYSHPELS